MIIVENLRVILTDTFCVTAVSQSHLSQLIEASAVLLRYIVRKLETATNSETKLLLPALLSLAVGRSQELDMEQMILASILKNAKCPEKFADKSMSASTLPSSTAVSATVAGSSAAAGSSSGPTGATSSSGSGNESNGSANAKAESKRSRSDLSTVILQQLTTPLNASLTSHAWTPLSEEPIDCTVSI